MKDLILVLFANQLSFWCPRCLQVRFKLIIGIFGFGRKTRLWWWQTTLSFIAHPSHHTLSIIFRFYTVLSRIAYLLSFLYFEAMLGRTISRCFLTRFLKLNLWFKVSWCSFCYSGFSCTYSGQIFSAPCSQFIYFSENNRFLGWN